ncbi:MAG: AAA family ATPase, partial [Acidimicrobiales bacterium]
MLVELAVRNLGVIAELRLVLDAGMTVLTGETGAGKTMLVEAIELLVGGKADPTLVRPGTEEATIEGRFVGDDNAEVVLTRVIPAVGRSRAYIDGRIAPAAALAACGEQLVDLHGQHAHQSLLGASTQRAALDAFAAIDLESLRTARREVARVDAALATLGGDERARAREIDLLSFQVRELSAAGVADPDEDEQLAAEEDLLGDAQAHQEAAAGAVDALTGDDATIDALGTAIAIVAGRAPFAAAEARLRIVAAELTDIACDLRSLAEGLDDDPDRLAALTARRQNLRDLRRKYGQTLAEVMAFAD